MNSFHIKAKCPYCGHESTFYTKTSFGKELITCLEKNGGCGGDFAAYYCAEISVVPKRIAGEEVFAARKKNRGKV